MRNIYSILLGMLFILPFALTSCEDNYQETNLGNSSLVLSASTSEITLDINNPTSNAVTFEWTAGSNFNTNAAITYTFELAIGGTNFANSIKSELVKGGRSVSYKTEELNSILLNDFSLSANSDIQLEARVTAHVLDDNIEPQVSEVLKVKAISYKPISSTLYLIGDATPNGWNADDATQMNSISGAAGGFVWQGKLNAGELKFITTLGAFLPSYNMGSDDKKIVLRESDTDPDNKFVIPSTGIYKITLNIITLAIHIEALQAPEYGDLWFVGGFTGWSFQPTTVDASDPFIFHYNSVLTSSNSSDEFKIATAPNFDNSTVFLRPEVNGQDAGTDLKVVKWSANENADDNKWKIAPGTYKIKLDIRDMKIDIVPFTPYASIYLVGDASPNGWDIGNATPMTAVAGESNKFIWTGNLNVGEFKFTCDRQDDWNGAWFLAAQNGIEPTGNTEQMIFSASGSNPDNKWKISTAGSYTIELDQLQETIRIKKN